MSDRTRSIIAALTAPVLVLLALLFMFLVLKSTGVNLRPAITLLLAAMPILLPLMLFFLWYEQWMWFIHEKFKYKNGRVTLRIKLPQEVLKSPEAMESVFNQYWAHQRPYNYLEAYFTGKHPLVSSFELVSHGGDVRFYINVPRKKVKNAVEAQLYAQFPGVEVVEEQIDYTGEVTWESGKWDLMSFHLSLIHI